MAHLLGSALSLRDVTMKNRIAISPMCQYSAIDGMVGDYHFAHLARFALGGAGLVMVEATAVTAQGRITHGCPGLWEDAQIAPMARIAAFIRAQGSVPAIQLGHAGRKGSMQRPWYGNGPLNAEDAARGDHPWEIIAPSAIPMDEGWLTPRAMEQADMDALIAAWCAAAERALRAGFDVIELHAAHGYLLHSFLSPLSNQRNDAFGGDRAGRMRFPLQVVAAVREAWPDEKPLSVRISAVDGLEGGWEIEDSVAFARELKRLGVDLVDCSSGGLGGSATAVRIPRSYGFQVPFAEQVRHEADIRTIAVGLVVEPEMANAIVAQGKADIVALGREALVAPNWPHLAARTLSGKPSYDNWPPQAGWWLERRDASLASPRG